MKHFFTFLLFISSGSLIKAQGLEDIKMMFGMNQFTNAKKAVDEFIQNPKKPKNATNAEAWYLKGQIYHYCSIEKGLTKSEMFNLKLESFESLKKCQELDPKDKLMSADSGQIHYLQLYAEISNLGVDYFNEKNFDSAMVSFIKANDIKDYTLQKSIRFKEIEFPVLDTVLIKNIAACALNAQKEEIAMTYFRKIADAGISGEDYLDVYRSLSEYYSKNKNTPELKSLLQKASKAYPGNIDMWLEYEIKSVDKNDRAQLLSKIEEMLVTYPNNSYLNYNYSVELYNDIWEGKSTDDISLASVENKIQKTVSAIKNAIQNGATEDAYNLNMLLCWHLGKAADVHYKSMDKIKGKTPADVKLKSDLKVKYNKVVDDYIVSLQNTSDLIFKLSSKTEGQKVNYKDILRQLKSIYEERKDTKNAALIQKKINEAANL